MKQTKQEFEKNRNQSKTHITRESFNESEKRELSKYAN